MSALSGLLFMLFYGMTTSVQDLGLHDIHLNGIFLGVNQSIGFIAIFPFMHKIKRRKWIINLQLVFIFSAIILWLTALFPKNQYIQITQTTVSTFCIAANVSAISSVFYTYIAEMFPAEIRGVATALILFNGKLIGVCAPFMCELSQRYGVHILVGCTVPVIISLPLSFMIDETLVEDHGDGDRASASGSDKVGSSAGGRESDLALIGEKSEDDDLDETEGADISF